MTNLVGDFHTQKLEVERHHILQELALLQTQLKIEASSDVADLATDLSSQVVVSSLMRRQKQKLTEIETALQLLQKGTYGICEGCHQPIDPERLEILPEAKYCLSCKMNVERLDRPDRTFSQRKMSVHFDEEE